MLNHKNNTKASAPSPLPVGQKVEERRGPSNGTRPKDENSGENTFFSSGKFSFGQRINNQSVRRKGLLSWLSSKLQSDLEGKTNLFANITRLNIIAFDKDRSLFGKVALASMLYPVLGTASAYTGGLFLDELAANHGTSDYMSIATSFTVMGATLVARKVFFAYKYKCTKLFEMAVEHGVEEAILEAENELPLRDIEKERVKLVVSSANSNKRKLKELTLAGMEFVSNSVGMASSAIFITVSNPFGAIFLVGSTLPTVLAKRKTAEDTKNSLGVLIPLQEVDLNMRRFAESHGNLTGLRRNGGLPQFIEIAEKNHHDIYKEQKKLSSKALKRDIFASTASAAGQIFVVGGVCS